MATISTLPPDVIHASVPALQSVVDALAELYAVAKLAHWNVRGTLRMPLHLLFGELANVAAEHQDACAEHVVQLGEMSQLSSVPAQRTTDPEGMVLCTVVVAKIQEALLTIASSRDVANEHGDLDTLDILTDASRALTKVGDNVIAYLHE